MLLQRGDRANLDIEKFADQGKGLARVDGLVVFVEGAVPGDRVRAKVTARKSSYAEARIEELLSASEYRTAPRCRYFPTCGGCQWQHADYDAQVAYKRRSVKETLEHQGGFSGVSVRPALAAEEPYYYRNRMDFTFSDRRWLTPREKETGEDFDMRFALGLHPLGEGRRVLDLKECHLQSPLSARLVNGVRNFARERGWPAQSNGSGYLRRLTIRQPTRTDHLMVHLLTRSDQPGRTDALAAFLQGEFPEVTTFVSTAYGGKLSAIRAGGTTQVHFGPGAVREKMGAFTFEIGPHDFFQPNTAQAERLYRAARDVAEPAPDDTVYDLYCGLGALSLFLAEEAGRVVGVEDDTAMTKKARRHAETHDLGNAAFASGAVGEVLTPAFAEEHGAPDVVVADPPRAGMREAVTERIARLQPRRLVYVSCNPQTQAHDLKRLAGEYAIDAVQPVDQFPQTHHIENVVALGRV
jgi:23S rRNA (uracil1939-C5)-methyltransferase